MSKIKILVLGFSLLSTIACAKTRTENAVVTANTNADEKPAISSTSVVKVSAGSLDINKGEAADGIVKLKVDSGYHVNANPPTFSYLKATELDVPATQELSVGFITYPDPVTRKFAFAEKSLAVYEGETTVKVHLKADKSAKPGPVNLPAKLRVQACDEQVCYAPGSIDFVIQVNIK